MKFDISLLFLIFLALFNVINSQVIKIDLGGERGVWSVSGNNGTTLITTPATVPGGIYSDLSSADSVFESEIYYRYNDKETKWVGRTDWTYFRNFELSEEVFKKSKIELICDGLDTMSKVYVNNQLVGSSDNMFVRYVFDIKSALQQIGSNNIRIEFQSPVNFGQNEWDNSPYPVLPECYPPEYQGECHANYIRKMQASFSWDWGPSYPSSGIYKPIYIHAYDSTTIQDVMLFITPNSSLPTENGDTEWNVTARVYFNGDGDGVLTLEAGTEGGSRAVKIPVDLRGRADGQADVSIRISGDEVKLWWPNGYGSQPLYNFTITFESSSTPEVSSKVLRSAYRTIQLVEEPVDSNDLTKGLSFYFKANGRRIYAKGSNSIPIHVLPERATKEMTEWLFLSAKETHMNMVRVWGGGIYETEEFYDFADENGILVWQDFMFACAMYPTSPNFLSSVRKEVETQVKRLQYRPSVAIWATNNENEAALRNNWYGTGVNFELYYYDYVRLYIETILDYVNYLDPSRACLPSSPTNGKESEKEGWVAQNPYSTLFGDVHYYDYVSDGWDYRALVKTRFASEYGFQSWPHPSTFRTGTSEELDWAWFSPMMYHRQHHPGGQEEILAQIQTHLPAPSSPNSTAEFLNMLYMAQITQSMSVKTQTEFYRRLKGPINEKGEGECGGALFWQLNDIWQGASWAAVEITGRWKMLMYYARNFFAPLITSMYDDDEGNVRIYTISDSYSEMSGNLRVRLFRMDSMTPVTDNSYPVTILPESVNEALIIPAADLAECKNSISICFLHTSLTGAPDNFFFLHYPNEASFLSDPSLRVSSISQFPDNKTFSLTISSQAIAPFVFLNLKNNEAQGWFSDNGFIQITPTKTITFKARNEMSLQEFEENLEIVSLFDVGNAAKK